MLVLFGPGYKWYNPTKFTRVKSIKDIPQGATGLELRFDFWDATDKFPSTLQTLITGE